MASCSNKAKPPRVAVVMVPFPAQGHLNQLLQLSCLISSYALPVHYVGSATHNRQARVRANGLNPQDLAKVQFHDLAMPAFTSPSPDPTVPSKFPAHLQPSWDATLHLRQPVAAFLHDFSSRFDRVVVVHDTLMAMVVQDVTLLPNFETYTFNCISAFTLFFMIWKSLGKPFEIEDEPEDLPDLRECMTEDAYKFSSHRSEYLNLSAGNLYNTCRLLEGKYIDLLDREEINVERKPRWAIGPILPTKLSSNSSPNKCLDWLDKQEANSVMYVSFGTTTSMTDDEIRELAMGLEQSKQKFIWVLRDSDKGDVFDEQVRRPKLPDGFEERVGGVGMVVRDWAPQPKILAHPSTGGFMSHCGWNSCIESITMGVPFAAWPMHSDQRWNVVLITDVLKIGLVVKKWGPHKKPVALCGIENVVRRLMASDEGEQTRKRAEELGRKVRQATEEGGVSRKELDSFIAHITS